MTASVPCVLAIRVRTTYEKGDPVRVDRSNWGFISDSFPEDPQIVLRMRDDQYQSSMVVLWMKVELREVSMR